MNPPGRRPATLVLLIRHAEQADLLDPDPDLSPRGRLQAQLLSARLTSLGLTGVVSSRLQRAVQTAEAVCDHCELPLEVLDGLEEVRLGPPRQGPPSRSGRASSARVATAGWQVGGAW